MGKIQPSADKTEPDFFFNCCSQMLQAIVASGTELRAGSNLSWAPNAGKPREEGEKKQPTGNREEN